MRIAGLKLKAVEPTKAPEESLQIETKQQSVTLTPSLIIAGGETASDGLCVSILRASPPNG